MIKEVADQFALYQSVHRSIDKMLDGLSDEQWMAKAGEEFNSIASVIEHVLLVEEKFLSGLDGESKDINYQRPFQDGPSELSVIKKRWSESMTDATTVLENLTQDELDSPGLRLGVSELNKRQLLSYLTLHAAHHRGQIPIIKKLNQR